MPGIVVTLTGNSTQYEAMMARSVAIAKATSISIQKEYEKAQLIVSGQSLAALNPLISGRNAASTLFNPNEAKNAAQSYGEFWTEALAKQEAGIAAVRAEELAFLTLVATGGGARSSNPALGGHGGGGITGIVREFLVIAREVSMGRGLGRIGGSVTLLAQYFGVLGLAVKSSASEMLIASKTATALSEKMAAQALAAKGTAAYTDLLAASQTQEAVAAQLATDANIALRGATVSLVPAFFIIAGAMAVAGIAAFILWRHFREAKIEAKNLSDALNPLKRSFTDLADAEKKAADATQENADFIKDILEKHNSESDAIERKIKLLKEQSAARGLSNRDTLEMEKKMLMAEQIRLTTERDAAIAAEQAASAADIAGATGKDFSTGKIISLDEAQAKAKRAGEIADAVQSAANDSDLSKVIEDLKSGAIGASRGHTRQEDINRYQADLDSTVFEITVNGKKMSISLSDAAKNFQLSSAQAKKLETDQKSLDDVLKDTKTTVKEKADALAKVQSDLTDINDELAHPVKERGGRMDVTERERIGFAGNAVADKQLQISTQHLEVAKETFKLIAGRQGDDGVGGAHFA